ncbi:NUDIX domain-containing protein [Corynebacterium sp. L4756]|uniref:NUDIX domain-containing protein n=1 Tax=Corynebacterium sp. L4756 TaxID=3373097 RepID=UPI00374DF287
MSITDPESLITVSATVIRDPHGRVLCVCKEGSPYFQLPGGKPEAGESSAQAATREATKELGVQASRLETVAEVDWPLVAADAEEAISREHTTWLASRTGRSALPPRP